MDRTAWVAMTSAAVRFSTGNWRPARPWKRRALKKSKNRLSHRAWKSRKVRGIPTFPPPRRRLREINETGHFTCYKKRTSYLAKNSDFFQETFFRLPVEITLTTTPAHNEVYSRVKFCGGKGAE